MESTFRFLLKNLSFAGPVGDIGDVQIPVMIIRERDSQVLGLWQTSGDGHEGGTDGEAGSSSWWYGGSGTCLDEMASAIALGGPGLVAKLPELVQW